MTEVPEHTPGAILCFNENGERVGFIHTPPPTFDEWWLAKNGASFESMCMADSMTISASMRALARALRDYVSEMAGRKS